MNAPRRIAPDTPARRGWCPGLSRPMPTGDGLLARIHPPLGILDLAQARAVAEAARRYGNGHVDVTARANLQIRGVTEATTEPLSRFLEAAGLGDTRADGGPQRLTLTHPLAELTPSAIDAAGLARRIEALGKAIAGLPAKTLVAVELPQNLAATADIAVRADGPGRAAIGLATDAGLDWLGTCDQADVAEAVAALLSAFARSGGRRVRDLDAGSRRPLIRSAPGIAQDPSPDFRPGEPDAIPAAGLIARPDGWTALTVQTPFGRTTSEGLDRLADTAARLGASDIHVSPDRGFVLATRAARAVAGRALAALAVDFIVVSDDPRSAVAACPGAPACASGSTPTGEDAARLATAFAPLAAQGLTAHVSGCAKGCARPSPADLTLVGAQGRYGIVLGGGPGGEAMARLTIDAALERVRRAEFTGLSAAFEPGNTRTTA